MEIEEKGLNLKEEKSNDLTSPFGQDELTRTRNTIPTKVSKTKQNEQTNKKTRQNIYNNSFQDTLYEATKDSDL